MVATGQELPPTTIAAVFITLILVITSIYLIIKVIGVELMSKILASPSAA